MHVKLSQARAHAGFSLELRPIRQHFAIKRHPLGASLYLKQLATRFVFANVTTPPQADAGSRLCSAQTDATVVCKIALPSSAASLRNDQCVEASVGLRLVVHASTRASIRSITF